MEPFAYIEENDRKIDWLLNILSFLREIEYSSSRASVVLNSKFARNLPDDLIISMEINLDIYI